MAQAGRLCHDQPLDVAGNHLIYPFALPYHPMVGHLLHRVGVHRVGQPTPAPSIRVACFAASLLTVLTACAVETRMIRDDFADLRALSDEAVAGAGGGKSGVRGERGFAIELARFTGPDRSRDAFQLTDALRRAGLADLWFDDADATLTVFAGRYRSAKDPAARDALARARKAEVDPALVETLGLKLEDADLVSITGGRRASGDPLDLRRHMGSYSLQIGFYDENFPGDPRAAAEQSARAFREQGYQAYYYHGPFRSSVTVGLFTNEDFVLEGTTEAYGPSIRELQQTFPYNLANGYPFEEKDKDGSYGPQRSSLIRVI